MAPITRRAAANKANGSKEPTKPILRVKLTLGRVRTAVQLATAQEQKTAIEEAATIEAGLRRAREIELQEALQVTRPTTPRQVPVTDALLEPVAGSTVGESSPCSNPEGEVSGSEEGTPLVYQSNGLMNSG